MATCRVVSVSKNIKAIEGGQDLNAAIENSMLIMDTKIGRLTLPITSDMLFPCMYGTTWCIDNDDKSFTIVTLDEDLMKNLQEIYHVKTISNDWNMLEKDEEDMFF